MSLLTHRLRTSVVAVSLTVAGCQPDSGGRTARDITSPAPTVPVSRALVRDVSDWDEFTGRFVASAEVQVRARASGYLTAIHFRDGQTVAKGDLLFTIDPRPYEASVKAAEASVAEIQASLDLSRTDLGRASQLLRTQAVAEATVDQRSAAVRRSEAQLLLAQANLLRAQLDLEYTQVRAPFAGRADRHYVDVGNLVTSDATVLTNIVTLDPIEFLFDVDQAAHLRYTRAAENGTRPSSREARNPVQLQLADETGFPHEGHVDFVSNQADPATGTIRARAVFSNGRDLLFPGIFGRIRLIGSAPYQAVLLPDEAIGTDQSQRFVYVLNRDNVPEQKRVELGRLIDGLRVVRAGVAPEDVVVIGGLQRVRPGQRVSPREETIDRSRPVEPAAGATAPRPERATTEAARAGIGAASQSVEAAARSGSVTR